MGSSYKSFIKIRKYNLVFFFAFAATDSCPNTCSILRPDFLFVLCETFASLLCRHFCWDHSGVDEVKSVIEPSVQRITVLLLMRRC